MNPLKVAYWRARDQAWDTLKRPVAFLAKRAGYELLSKSQTVSYLAPYRTAVHPAGSCTLPAVNDVVDPAKLIFREMQVVTAPAQVWRYIRNGRPDSLLRCGLLLADGKVLNTDYWSDDALSEAFRSKPRPVVDTRTLLAPLGHYFDGNKFVGYYDFMFLIAAKLCRLKEAASAEDYQEAVVAYPLVNTPYEQEMLALLGFGPTRVFDSRLTDVHAEVCYLGNHDNWLHPNPADIRLLKKHLEPLLRRPRTAHNRIYISRAGRRRIVNEADLIAMLIQFGFVIIDDVPRSLAEQHTIYHNAAFIIGPHGASFTNLLWCEPGTHLLELFTARFAQTHFRYLAQVLELTYLAYCQDANPHLDYSALTDDITVSVPELERYLSGLFGEK